MCAQLPDDDPIELTVEWPAHGRPLTLGAVEPQPGQSPSELAHALWNEVHAVARRVGLESPDRFRSISVEWTSRGRTVRARLHTCELADPGDLGDVFRRQLTQTLASRPPHKS